MRFAMRCSTCHVMLMVGAILIAGCSGKGRLPSSPQPIWPFGPSTQFKGSVVGSEGVGTIVIAIATPPPPLQWSNDPVGSSTLVARGLLRLSSGYQVVYLVGTYDTSAHSLRLATSAWTLGGTLEDGVLRGELTTTSGSNVYIAQEQGAGADTVMTFCGYEGSCGASVFNAGLGVRGESVAGVVQRPEAPYTLVTTFTGSFSAIDSSLVLVDLANPTGPPIGVGRLRTNAYTTWATVEFVFTPGDTCHWSGSRRE
jgi:hypothetical protein